MKQLLLAVLLPLLAACAPKGSPLMMTVSGVTMADLEPIRIELSAVVGVSDVRAGQLKDGQATFALKYDGKGGFDQAT